MAVSDILSQDEIDALLHGVDSGDVETEKDDLLPDGSARPYNFTSQDRIVRGRLPTLEMINERFARYFRISLFNMLRRSPEISVGGVQMLKFAEYVHSLFVPTSLNMVQIQPQSQTIRLKRYASGAKPAWDEFVLVYGPLVFRVARRQGLQPTDADDLVQEVFSAVAKQVGDWLQRPDRGSFRAWLLRMARNIAVNLLTRKPFGATGIGGNEVGCRLEEVLGQGDEFSSRFDLEYRREVFRWAAEQVRESVAATTWQAFHLTHLEGVSTADAARQLGISVGNVYIARSRVTARIRQEIQAAEGE